MASTLRLNQVLTVIVVFAAGFFGLFAFALASLRT
jgi:hypothetical protein